MVMKINILVIFEVDHNSNMKIFNLSIYCFSWWILSMLIKYYHWIQKIFKKKYLDKLLPHPLSKFNEPYCGTFYTSYKLLDNHFWLSIKWIDKITILNLHRHFFSNLIDPRVVKMLTYCQKKQKKKMIKNSKFCSFHVIDLQFIWFIIDEAADPTLSQIWSD